MRAVVRGRWQRLAWNGEDKDVVCYSTTRAASALVRVDRAAPAKCPHFHTRVLWLDHALDAYGRGIGILPTGEFAYVATESQFPPEFTAVNVCNHFRALAQLLPKLFHIIPLPLRVGARTLLSWPPQPLNPRRASAPTAEVATLSAYAAPLSRRPMTARTAAPTFTGGAPPARVTGRSRHRGAAARGGAESLAGDVSLGVRAPQELRRGNRIQAPLMRQPDTSSANVLM